MVEIHQGFIIDFENVLVHCNALGAMERNKTTQSRSKNRARKERLGVGERSSQQFRGKLLD